MIGRQLAVARALKQRAVRPSSVRRRVPAAPVVPRLTYVVCTTPRSGSWLLSEGLASTSVAGNPREWFNHLEEQEERARWRMTHGSDLTFAKYLEQVQARSTTRNGVSGIKLHYYQFLELPSKLGQLPQLDRKSVV